MPRKTPEQRLTFRLPVPLVKKLERVARANERTMSAELRHLIKQANERKAA